MNKKILFGLIGAIVATGARATDDGRILTTQTYVDNALESKVDIAQGAGDNNENVGKTLVVNQQGNLELGTVSADNFVEDSITDGVTNKAPSENAVHDALENKQNTIATDMVDFHGGVADLPAIVTYDSTDGVTGNKIGILDQETILGDEGNLSVYNTNDYGAQMDNYVPTVRAVADGLQYVLDMRPDSFAWQSSYSNPINNYSTAFTSINLGADGNWPRDYQYLVPTAETFANGLALKQNKIATGMVDFNDGVADLPAITTYDSTDGVTGNKIGILDYETILGDEGGLNMYNTNEYGAQMDNYVPTVRAVAEGLASIWNAMPHRLNWSSSLQTPINNYSTAFTSTNFGADGNWPNNDQRYLTTAETLANGLALKQNKIPAGTAGNVVTYTGTQGVVGSVATANAPTYNATTGALTNGTSIATIAAVDTVVQTKQNKMTCTRWLDTPEHPGHNDDNCLLWDLGN